MNAARLKRLIVVSAAPVGPTPENEALLIRWLLLPIVSRLLREHYDDLAEMESAVKRSATEWTIVRPPRLTSGPASGRYRIRVGGTIARGYSISRANVAHAMLAAVTDPGMVRKVIGVAN